jgi:hypothetical protein
MRILNCIVIALFLTFEGINAISKDAYIFLEGKEAQKKGWRFRTSLPVIF